MKGHKGHHGRKHRNTGGVNEAEMDLRMNPEDRVNASKIASEAEEKKHGGRAKRKHGMKVHGEHAKHHAGRKPRKSGGSCDSGNPFSSARKGTPPKGRGIEMEYE
jgi:hypothetical protein